MKVSYRPATGVAVLVLLFVIGCASKGVAPTEAILGAEMAIKSAESSDAVAFAPLELKIAEEKLNAARTAVEKEEYVKAERLASEALTDARLAETKTRSEKARKTAAEIRETLETLRQEMKRGRM
jgi:hypothetical protein